jgi:hypothetical protein
MHAGLLKVPGDELGEFILILDNQNQWLGFGAHGLLGSIP